MTRSAYAVTSALTVACTGCKAAVGRRCTSKKGYEMSHCHPTRRKAADEKRTAEVNPSLAAAPPFFTPSREPLPPNAFRNDFSNPLTPETFQSAKQIVHARVGQPVVFGTEILGDVPPEIPLREYAPARVADLCPDEGNHGPLCGCDDCEEERNR